MPRLDEEVDVDVAGVAVVDGVRRIRFILPFLIYFPT